MGNFADLFAGVNFKGTIQKYCAQQSWKIYDLNDRRAVLRFDMSSGRTQTLYIIKYETTLEFSVPSALAFDSDDDVPHRLSTLLLRRNAERKIGFWCVEDINQRVVFSCMHNAEMQLLDGAYFASVVRALINECDDFEDTISKMMRG